MAYYFNSWAIPSIITSFLFLCLAYLLYKTRPENWINRILALVGVCWGLSDLGNGLILLSADPETALFWRRLSLAFFPPIDSLLLYFAISLPGRPSSWSRNKLVRLLLVGYPAAFWAILISYPSALITNPAPSPTGWSFGPGSLSNVFTIIDNAFGLLGLLVLVSKYLSTDFDITRKQLRIFIAAAAVLFSSGALIEPATYPIILSGAELARFDLAGVILLPLITYGILKYQLFDLEIKVKRGVKYSILLAIFFGIVLTVEQLLQQYLTQTLGSIIGVILGAVIIITSVPIQKMAEQASGRIFQGVSTSNSYLEWKRMEVYKAALIEVVSDQKVSEREKRMLDNLREKLELSEEDVNQLKEDLLKEKAKERGIT